MRMHSRARSAAGVVAAVIVAFASLGRTEAAPVARGCDVVESETGVLLGRFPGPVSLAAPPSGTGALSLTLWGLPLSWTPGTPLPTRGPIFPTCGPGAGGAKPVPVPDDDSWQGILLHAATLDNDGDRDAAALAWQDGVQGLAASGVRADRVFALPATGLVPAAAIRRALAAEDAERASASLAHIASTFPFLREGADAYASFAAWLRQHGRGDLADAWDARAAISAASFMNDDRRAAAAAERVLPFALGAFLALPLFGLVLGLGLGAQTGRRRLGPPGPLALPLVGLGTLLLVAAILCATLAGQLDTVAKHREVPTALLEDGMAAPEVSTWIATRVRPEARARLLANVDAERAAMAAGKRADAPPPSDQEMRLALAPSRGFGDRLQAAVSGLHLTTLIDRPVPRLLAPIDSLARAFGALLVAIVLGFGLGRAAPRAWRWAHLVVPGASRWLGPLSGLVTMFTLAALVALTGVRAGQALARPDVRHVFGLDGLPLPPLAGAAAPTWVLPVLVAAIGVHVLGIFLDRRFGGAGVDNPGRAG